MRILHVIHTLNPASGGTAEAVRNFLLHPHDTEQAVLTLDHASDPWTKSYASMVFCVGPGRGQYGYTRLLRHWLEANLAGYDAAIVHGCWQYHGVAVSRAARKVGRPYLIFPHGMLDPYFNEVSCAKRIKKGLYWRWERGVLENAKAVLFTCAEERERAHRSFRFSSSDRIAPLGIAAPASSNDALMKELRERYPEITGKRVVLFLGRLHPKKGIDLLIKAFTSLADSKFHLLVIGPEEDEAYTQSLRALAKPMFSSITFTGILTGRLKAGALAAAELLALPSHQENFGLSIVEALAFGCPVILSDKVNIWREIVEDGAGFVAPDTLEGTSELLRQWQSLSSDTVEAMGRAAISCFNSRFRAESASAKLISILRECGAATNERSRLELESAHN